MLGFLTRSRPDRNRVPGATRLWLEELERRECPAAPQITVFNAVVQAGHIVQLNGSVLADQLQGVSITFSGAASGSTTTNASGNFSYSTSTASLGTVYAVGVDQQQQQSSPASTIISVTPPSLTLSLSYGSGCTITLSGQLTGIDQGYRPITISGVASGTVNTNSSGAFSYTTDASALGNAQASTVDLWGQASNTPQVTVTSNAPVIHDFTAICESGNLWTFRGRVVDESAPGLTVTLGGLPSLASVTATVASDGWFTRSALLQTGEEGTATAITTDWWGLDSNTALAIVRP